MAVSKQEVILEFNADTTDVTKGIDNVEKSIEGTSKATAGLTTQLDKMTGGAVTGLKNFTAGLKSGVAGLKTFKVALAATGIGALVIAVGTLISYFTNTKRGAEQLSKATAALGAAFDVIKDRISALGGALVKFFTGDFKGALEDVQDAFTGITDEIIREAAAARDLQDAMNSLKDAERGFIRQRAETNKAIAETRLRVEDETLSYDERILALEQAIALEEQTVARELELAEERARIIRERIELGESLEDDLDAQAEAEARVIELQTSSLRTQKRLEGERQSLLLQRQAQIEATISAERKAAEDELKILDETVKALKKRQEEAAKELGIPTEEIERGLMTSQQRQTEIVESESDKRKRLRREEAEAFRELVLGDEEMLIDTTKNTLGVLSDLNKAFEGESETERKKAFERQKKIQIAQTLISTYESATQAFKSLAGIPVVGPVLGAAAAVAAVKSGLNNVKQIKAQTYEGGGGAASTSSPSPSLSGAATQATQAPQAPQIDLSFLGEGAVSEAPIQAYVISQDVSNAQQANQQIQEQAQL